MAMAILSGQSATGQVVSLLNDSSFRLDAQHNFQDYTMPRDPAAKQSHSQNQTPYNLPSSYPNVAMPSMSHIPPPLPHQYSLPEQTNSQHSNHTSPNPSPQSPSQPLSHPDSAPVHGQAPQQEQPPQNAAPKKKHVCPTCDRAFTTSGHLARHTRVHTGERNHKCPFPGCETRCSRQDNLQQHYRIHLSPGSRRSNSSATRAAIQRAMSSPNAAGAAQLQSPTSPMSAPPPPNAPPPLAHAHAPPPPLAQASSRSSSDRSPETRYSAYGNGLQEQHSAYSGGEHNSPPHSASSSPVLTTGGTGPLYTAHGQTAYTFAPQPQVPMTTTGPGASTVYASPYQTTSYNHYHNQQQRQRHQHQQHQHQQNSDLHRSNSTSSQRSQNSHSHSIPSSSGSPSPISPRESAQSPHLSDPSSPYYTYSNQQQHSSSGGGGSGGGPFSGGNSSASSTPGNSPAVHPHSFLGSSSSSAYAFQLQPPPSSQQNGHTRYDSPPPVLAPIRKDSAGNPYPQLPKGFTS